MSGPELSRRLQLFYLAVERAPMTNIKSMNGEILTYLTAAFLAIAAIMKWTIDEPILYAWLAFLAGKIGFAMGGAWAKRVTDPAFVEAKERGKASGNPAIGNVENANISTTQERPVPAPSRSTDAVTNQVSTPQKLVITPQPEVVKPVVPYVPGSAEAPAGDAG